MNRIVRFWPLRCLNVSASKAAIYMLKSRRPKTFYSANKKCTFWWQVTSNTTPGCEQAHIAIDRILWLDCFGNCTTKWGAKWLPSLLFICAAQDLGNGKARKMAPSSVDRRVSFCLKPCWFILKIINPCELAWQVKYTIKYKIDTRHQKWGIAWIIKISTLTTHS